MRTRAIFLALSVMLTACAAQQIQQTLGQAKTGLVCIEYKDGIVWKQASDAFGVPIAPLPEPGTELTRNARIYKDRVVIFYTDKQEVTEEGKTRFKEVVKKVEICKEK